MSLQIGANRLPHTTLQNYGFAAGLGVRYSSCAFNYAFSGDTESDLTLGYGHRVSLIVQFSNPAQGVVK
ncbi:MAG: hypothetical protein ACLFVQ_04615 [Chitinispirillaceae bacterium]